MKSSNSPIEHLKLMINLEEKRADLQAELNALESQLDQLRKALVSGGSVSFSPLPPKATTSKSSSSKPAKGRKAPHGALRDKVFSALEKAGAAGVRVLDLARELETNPANIYAWFHAAVKRYPSIKKAGAATYRLVGKAPKAEEPAAAPATAPAPAKSKATSAKAKAAPTESRASKASKAEKTTGKSNRRGALQARILSALESAGSKGATIKDLSEKFNMPYRNVQVWFATTGKKNPAVKKVGPATYQYAG